MELGLEVGKALFTNFFNVFPDVIAKGTVAVLSHAAAIHSTW
jgi:hypothetical protein